MNKLLLNAVLLFLMLSPFFIQAQALPREKISGIFSGISFESFAQMVEAKSAYHFSFTRAEADCR